MGEGPGAVETLPHRLVVLHGEPEHVVKVLAGQLRLGVQRHEAVLVHGVLLQHFLGHRLVVALDGRISGQEEGNKNEFKAFILVSHSE